jgi:transposase
MAQIQTRQRLVDLVISMGFSIGRAARKLKVKLSTAKMIVKRYRVRGDFFESKRLRAERLNTDLDRNSSIDKRNHDTMGKDPAA